MKIGIVGAGQVGATAAYAMTLRGVGSEIVLVDRKVDLAVAQANDILHGTPWSCPVRVRAGEALDLDGAGIVVLAAGANQKPGESQLDLLTRNAEIFAEIVPPQSRRASARSRARPHNRAAGHRLKLAQVSISRSCNISFGPFLSGGGTQSKISCSHWRILKTIFSHVPSAQQPTPRVGPRGWLSLRPDSKISSPNIQIFGSLTSVRRLGLCMAAHLDKHQQISHSRKSSMASRVGPKRPAQQGGRWRKRLALNSKDCWINWLKPVRL